MYFIPKVSDQNKSHPENRRFSPVFFIFLYFSRFFKNKLHAKLVDRIGHFRSMEWIRTGKADILGRYPRVKNTFTGVEKKTIAIYK